MTDNGYRASGPGRANAPAPWPARVGRQESYRTEGEPGTPSGTGTPPDLEGIDLDVAMTQHLLVAADRYDSRGPRAICESRLCDMVDGRRRRRRSPSRTTHALNRMPRVRRAAPGGGDADGRVQAHGACPQLASELLRRWRCTRRSNSRLPRPRRRARPRRGAGDVGFGAQPSPTPAAVAGGTAAGTRVGWARWPRRLGPGGAPRRSRRLVGPRCHRSSRQTRDG